MKTNLIRFRTFAQTIAQERRTKRLENIGKATTLAFAGTAEALVFANLGKLTDFAATMFACTGVAVSILVILGLMFRQADRRARFTDEFADFVYPFSRGEPIPQEFANEDPKAVQALKTMAKAPSERLKFKFSTLDKVTRFKMLSEAMEATAEKLAGTQEVFNQAQQSNEELMPRLEEISKMGQKFTKRTLSSIEGLNVASRASAASTKKLAKPAHQLTELTEEAGELEEGLRRLEKSYRRTQHIVSSLKALDEAGAFSFGAKTKNESN